MTEPSRRLPLDALANLVLAVIVAAVVGLLLVSTVTESHAQAHLPRWMRAAIGWALVALPPVQLVALAVQVWVHPSLRRGRPLLLAVVTALLSVISAICFWLMVIGWSYISRY